MTIIAITGATLGQVSLLKIEACANQSIVGVLGSERIPTEFTYFWISEIKTNCFECHALAALRDALLPRRLSGQLRIKDAERIAAGVA